MEVVACICLMAFSHHVCSANLGIPFALFAFATSVPLSLSFAFTFEEDLCVLDDFEDLKDWDRFPELLLVFDVPLDEEPSLLPLPFPFVFFLHPLLSGG